MTRLPSSPAYRYRQLGPALSGVTMLPLESLDPRVLAPWQDVDDLWRRLDADTFAEELDIFGVLDAIGGRGYRRLSVGVERAWTGSFVGRVCGASALDAPPSTLLELALWREYCLPVGEAGGQAWRALGIEQLVLQDPAGAYERDRPRLPGQEHPGLGVAMRILALLRAWGARLSADAVTAIPEFFHSAVIYARAFTYVDAEMQGIFEAARRDLRREQEPLAEPSWAFENGLVRRNDSPYLWPTELQALPISVAADAFFADDAYLTDVGRARDRTHFALSADATSLEPR